SRIPMLRASRAAIVCESFLPLVMRTRRAATANYRPTTCGPAPRKEPLATQSRRFPLRRTGHRRRHRLRRRRGAVLGGGVRGRAAGFSPADIVFHRFVWAGLVFLPLVARDGLRDLGGLGWAKGVALTLVGGPPLAFLSYAGFLFVPLAHGGVIQPSCAALGGLLLATVVLKEKLPARRAAGAAVIVAGLAVIGADALATIGTHGLIGDLSFVTAGLMFAGFATLLRLWHIAPTRAVAVTSVVSLVDVAIQWLGFGFERMIALG